MRRIVRSSLIAGLLASSAAAAETFTLFVFESPAELARRADPGADGHAYWKEYADFGATLQVAGAIRGGSPLEPAAGLSAGDLPLGGYFVIDVADRAAAERFAADVPAARRGGRVLIAAPVASPAMAGAR